MTSRRVRGPAAHRVADRAATCKTLSVCYLLSRAPRWRAATGKGAGCQAAHRVDGAAARWGHRALPQRDTSGAHGHGAMRGLGEEGGGDATAGHERGARSRGSARVWRGRGKGRDRGARRRGAEIPEKKTCGKSECTTICKIGTLPFVYCWERCRIDVSFSFAMGRPQRLFSMAMRLSGLSFLLQTD